MPAMELIDLLRIIGRRLWLIVAIVVVSELALYLGVRAAGPQYAATVSLQITIPQREDVAAYDQYRYANVRDEITIAINNLVELLQDEDVRQRVVSQLGLGEDGNYTLEVERLRDADFVNVTVQARTPSLAAEIANQHVAVAIAYYGELRAKSTEAEKSLFAEQLGLAEQNFQSAENALANFRVQHGIFSLESRMSTQQRLLEQLQLERDRLLLEQAETGIAATGSLDEADRLIARRQQEMDRFTALAPEYNVLVQNVEAAQATYEHLLDKYNEAQLKVTAVQAANFIQVIKPAYAPDETVSDWPKLATLALAGSLGLGVLSAFLLEYFSNYKKPDAFVSGGRKIIPQEERPLRKNRSSDGKDAGPAPLQDEFLDAKVK